MAFLISTLAPVLGLAFLFGLVTGWLAGEREP